MSFIPPLKVRMEELPVRTIHEELSALLDWNPPVLSLGLESGSRSKVPHEPTFYDKHLAPDLILKHVKGLPTLTTALASVVEKRLQYMSDCNITLPGLVAFPTLEDRISTAMTSEMKNELHIAEHYLRTTAVHCMKVASTLGLHPGAKGWFPIIQWTATANSGTYGIADGCLEILKLRESDPPVLRAREQHCYNHMDEGVPEILSRSKVLFPALATWEIKSLSDGPLDVMQGILGASLDENFPWQVCNGGPPCNRRKVMKSRVGPDATDTPWVIDINSYSATTELSTGHSDLEEGSSQRLSRMAEISPDPLRGDNSPTSEGEDALPVPSPFLSVTGKQRQHIRIYSLCSTPKRTEAVPASPSRSGRTCGRRNKKGSVRASKRKREGTDQNNADPAELISHTFLQQAWAKAVRNDTSLVILHSGNYEYICVRHRKSQTLFVSDLIEVHSCRNPGYGRLQIGLYIAALQDTLNRTKQVMDEEESNRKMRTPPGDASLQGRDADSRGGDSGDDVTCKRLKTDKSSAGKDQSSSKGRAMAMANTDSTVIQESSSRSLAFVYLQYGIYDSPAPASFSRSKPSLSFCTVSPTPSPSRKGKKSHSSDEYITLILESEIGHGATGVAHNATLELVTSEGPVFTLKVVVKLALSVDQQHSLQHEYSIYQHLAQRGVTGVVSILGLFDDMEGCATGLVMTYGGVALGSSRGVISSSERESFFAKLKEIHEAGVLHGDLRRQNLLIDKSGHATIIDFDKARISLNLSMMESERVRLRAILDEIASATFEDKIEHMVLTPQ